MTAYNDVIINRQSAEFCPSIFVAIQLHGNQPAWYTKAVWHTPTYQVYHNHLLVGVEKTALVTSVFRMTTHLENLEKSGNFKVVKEKSGKWKSQVN